MACSPPADQGASGVGADYARCLEAAKSVEPAINACQDAERARQDAALDAAFARALQSVNVRQQPKLVEAQRRWIAFRDADCAWRDVGDPALDRHVRTQCRARMTSARIEALSINILQREN